MKANIDKSNTGNDLSQFSRSKITTATMIALIPSVFSILGVHDFMLKKRDQGILHLIIVVFALAVWLIFNASCSGNNQGVCSLSWLLPIIFEYIIAISLYIWSIIEGVKLLKERNQIKIYQDGTAKISEPEALDKIEKGPQEQHSRAPWSILSIVTAVPALLFWAWFLFVLLHHGNNISDNIESVLLILGYFYLSIGLPLFIVSIIFAKIGYKTAYRKLSVASLCIKIITIFMALLAICRLWLH